MFTFIHAKCLSRLFSLKMRRSLLLFVLCSLLSRAFGANILYLSGVASPSHHIFNRALALGLAESGHNVTFLSADISKSSHPNLHYIHLENVYTAVYAVDDAGTKFDLLEASKENEFKAILSFHDFIKRNCEGIFSSQGLEKILEYPDNFKFDVAVHDFTCGPCLLPLIHKFNNTPLVALTAFSNPPYTTLTIGGQKYPSYIPHYLLDYTTTMTFFQRLHNTALQAWDKM